MAALVKLGNQVETLSIAGHKLKAIPDAVFLNLPCLKWLDLRDNYLISLPESLVEHPSLEVVLLDNNLFTEVPEVLATLPKLKMIGIRGNIIPKGKLDVLR